MCRNLCGCGHVMGDIINLSPTNNSMRLKRLISGKNI